jgi:NAD(P)-dependent dehydrogenase (short-subunit alcohol dehydrogenase family)
VLERSAPSRVVNVASDAHKFVSALRLNAWEEKEYGSGMDAYGNSKLANILFTHALCERIKASGAKIYANSLHPGTVATDIIDKTKAANWLKAVARVVLPLLAKSANNGALTQLYVATHADIEAKEVSNVYFVPTAQPKALSAYAKDRDAAERLWAWSEENVRRIVGGSGESQQQ